MALRPRYRSSKMRPTSSSSIGSLLDKGRVGVNNGQSKARQDLLDSHAREFFFAVQEVLVKALVELLTPPHGERVQDRSAC